MVSTYVLVRTIPGMAFEVVRKAKKVKGVKEAVTVTGPVDVILKVSAEDLKMLGDLIVSGVQGIEGVRSTITCLIA